MSDKHNTSTMIYSDCGLFGFFKTELKPDSLCGEDTTFQDGKCTGIQVDPEVYCGEDTAFQDGRCMSTVEITSDNASMCGHGTVFWDGECTAIQVDPKLYCGENTVFQDGEPLGKCISTVEIPSVESMCGEGTALRDGKCVPDTAFVNAVSGALSSGTYGIKANGKWCQYERDLIGIYCCLLYTSPSPRD